VFATAAINIIKARIEEEDTTLTSAEVAAAMEVYLTPVGVPPTYPYFWHEWEISDDGTVMKSVHSNHHMSTFQRTDLDDSKGALPEFCHRWHICHGSCCGV
jgi:hypothetical protein